LNKDLLLKVKDAILAEPLEFDMAGWALNNMRRRFEDHHWCGTTHCIGGYALTLSGIPSNLPGMSGNTIFQRACEALDIDSNKGADLFYTDDWPHNFRRDYYSGYKQDDFAKMADAAARRIDQFIEENDK
jgi:hypothetical protein